MEFFRKRDIYIIPIVAVVLMTGIFFVLQNGTYANQVRLISNSLASATILPDEPPAPPLPKKLSNPPEIIKAVYVTAYSAGSRKYLDYLNNLLDNTEINAVVIDVKDSSGHVSYNSGVEDAKKSNAYVGAIKDIDALVRFFHDKNVYVIGRIAVFEDPVFSKFRPDLAIYDEEQTMLQTGAEPVDVANILKPVLWQDNNGLFWLDPASKDVWDYNIAIAKDALLHGFDEINFDYIRFPSDGNEAIMGFPIWDGKIFKSEIIKEFFKYLRFNLKGERISADLFGQTTTNKDGMGIGQLIENAFENFDYISPMVYPSHYINGFLGFDNPAGYPYEIIKYSMQTALAREKAYLANLILNATEANLEAEMPIQEAPVLAKFRPWLQDFNMGADYTADMVKLEIKATQDALGLEYNGFMLWSPSNIYTQGAILKPD